MQKKLLSLFLIFSLFSGLLFADSKTPEPYNKDELPQSLQDLRRFEIITLGAMPFVMLDTTLVYSTYHKLKGDMNTETTQMKTTPFVGSLKFPDKETKKKGQTQIFFISLGVSVGIGVTDLCYHHVKRTFVNRREEKINRQDISIEVLEDTTVEVPEEKMPEEYCNEIPHVVPETEE